MAAEIVNVAALPLDNPRGVESVYANNAGLAITPWDIRIIFSEILPSQGIPTVALRANVVMTLSHAKALGLALNTALQNYELEHGEIVVPSQPVPPGE